MPLQPARWQQPPTDHAGYPVPHVCVQCPLAVRLQPLPSHSKLKAAAQKGIKRSAPVVAAAAVDPLTECQQQAAALQAQVDALNASLAGAQAALNATQTELDSVNVALVQRDADVAGEGAAVGTPPQGTGTLPCCACA